MNITGTFRTQNFWKVMVNEICCREFSFYLLFWKYYKPYLKLSVLSYFIPIIIDLSIFIPNGFYYRNNILTDYLYRVSESLGACPPGSATYPQTDKVKIFEILCRLLYAHNWRKTMQYLSFIFFFFVNGFCVFFQVLLKGWYFKSPSLKYTYILYTFYRLIRLYIFWSEFNRLLGIRLMWEDKSTTNSSNLRLIKAVKAIGWRHYYTTHWLS